MVAVSVESFVFFSHDGCEKYEDNGDDIDDDFDDDIDDDIDKDEDT